MIRIIYGFKVGLERREERVHQEVFSPLRDEAVEVSVLDYLSLNEMFLSFSAPIFIKKETGLDFFVVNDETYVVGVKYDECPAFRFSEVTVNGIASICSSSETRKISRIYDVHPSVWAYSVDD